MCGFLLAACLHGGPSVQVEQKNTVFFPLRCQMLETFPLSKRSLLPALYLDSTYCQISSTLHISLSDLEQVALNFTLPLGGASVDTRRRSTAIGGAAAIGSATLPPPRDGAALPPPSAAPRFGGAALPPPRGGASLPPSSARGGAALQPPSAALGAHALPLAAGSLGPTFRIVGQP